MNYIRELNIFYHRIDTEDIPANAILLWYTLMSIANSLHWKEEFNVSISLLESKTKLSKSSICRIRKVLVQKGFIEYRPQGGKLSGIYKIIPLPSHLVCHTDTQSGTQEDLAFHTDTLSGNIHKHKTIYTKENIKRKNEVGTKVPPLPINLEEKKERKSCAKKKEKRELTHVARAEANSFNYAEQEGRRRSQTPLFQSDKWFETLDPPWQELMQTWLEYKSSRKERYKSEMSATKCLAQLQKLSGNDSQIAQQIIDQSIANNWAGLFELKRQAYYARGTPTPARGQHIGQIKQPESEEKKNRILANFGKKQE